MFDVYVVWYYTAELPTKKNGWACNHSCNNHVWDHDQEYTLWQYTCFVHDWDGIGMDSGCWEIQRKQKELKTEFWTKISEIRLWEENGHLPQTQPTWGKTLPRSTGMLPSVLMRERTSLQPTSVWVRLMTWQKANTIYFRLVVRKRNIEFQIDESHSAKLSSWLNAIGQFIFQYCVMWTTNLKFTVYGRT